MIRRLVEWLRRRQEEPEKWSLVVYVDDIFIWHSSKGSWSGWDDVLKEPVKLAGCSFYKSITQPLTFYNRQYGWHHRSKESYLRDKKLVNVEAAMRDLHG